MHLLPIIAHLIYEALKSKKNIKVQEKNYLKDQL